MREVPVAEVTHPLVDHAGTCPDGSPWVATESRAPVVHLNPLRVNLAAQAAAEGVRVALVTDEHSCLTRGFAHRWRLAGGAWVVRNPTDGLRDGFSGRALPGIGDAWTAHPAGRPDAVDSRHLRPQRADAVQLTVLVSERHPARESVVLGGTVEAVAETLLGAPPYAWGTHEPVDTDWDRAALTALVRERMPAETAVLAVGDRLAATVTARRTVHGVEEATHATAALLDPSPSHLAVTRAGLDGELARLTERSMPLIGLVLARPGRRDLLVSPLATEPAIPLTLLIGAPAVRTLDLDAHAMAERFGGRVVGRPRLPALLLPLGAYEPAAWVRLDEIVAALDPGRLETALGPVARALWADRPPASSGVVGAP